MIDTSKDTNPIELIELYVVGRPRSGTVWLNKLVADVLRSPMETIGPNADPPLWLNPDRSGRYVIRKTQDEKRRGPTVFIQRDPRDVAVSRMFYRGQTEIFPVVQQMIEPKSTAYEPNVRLWLDFPERAEIFTRYETLQKDGVRELRRIILALTGDELPFTDYLETYKRQSFTTVKQDDTDGRYNHSMRKGIVGDWRNHFTREIGQYLQQHMGEFLLEQNYVRDSHWWKDLPVTTETK